MLESEICWKRHMTLLSQYTLMEGPNVNFYCRNGILVSKTSRKHVSFVRFHLLIFFCRSSKSSQILQWPFCIALSMLPEVSVSHFFLFYVNYRPSCINTSFDLVNTSLYLSVWEASIRGISCCAFIVDHLWWPLASRENTQMAKDMLKYLVDKLLKQFENFPNHFMEWFNW